MSKGILYTLYSVQDLSSTLCIESKNVLHTTTSDTLSPGIYYINGGMTHLASIACNWPLHVRNYKFENVDSNCVHTTQSFLSFGRI